MAISGMTGAVYVSDVNAAPVSFNDEPCSAVDAERKRFRIDDPDLRYWDPEAPVTVMLNGVLVTPPGYTLEHCGGFIVLGDAADSEDEISVSGKALTLIQAGGFFNWSIDLDGEDADATTFKSGGWKEFKRTLKGWSGSAEAFWGDTQFFDSLGKTVVVKMFVDSGPAQDCFEGFAVISGDGIEASVEGLVEETVDFTGTGSLYIRMDGEEEVEAQGMGLMGGPGLTGGLTGGTIPDPDEENNKESEVSEKDED